MIFIRSLLPVCLVLSLAGAATGAEMTEPELLSVLGSDAGLQEKARACQQLAVVGGPKSVPALAKLLNQEHLADYARSGLEAIRDPAAGAALRKALPGLEGRLLAGVVNSLGVRRERAAVRDLEKLALDPKRGVAAEALASLGMIGTTDAVKALDKALTDGPAELRVPAAHASLVAAAHLAKENNRTAARKLLERVVRSAPPAHIAAVAERQVAALGAK
jgi:hypothetical protein